MEDCRIPEEYFTCHAVGLFDLLAGELARFAQRMGRCGPRHIRHTCVQARLKAVVVEQLPGQVDR